MSPHKRPLEQALEVLRRVKRDPESEASRAELAGLVSRAVGRSGS